MFILTVVVGILAIYRNDFSQNMEFGVHESLEQIEIVFGFSWLLLILVMFLISRMKLVTIIDEEGVRIGFDSGMRKKSVGDMISYLVGLKYWNFKRGAAQRTVSKDLIIRYEIISYKAILEYGGRGYRKRLGKFLGKRNSDIAYTVRGKLGLQLFLTDGQKILIGTHKPESVKRAMKKLMNEGGIVDV